MKRYLDDRVRQDIQKKMVLLTGPRLVECKLSDSQPHRALARFGDQWPQAQAVQLVRECKAEAEVGRLQIRDAAPWLAALEV
jgi:hypothetical protein